MRIDLHMLTTTDNPFDPLTDYDAWYNWDRRLYDSNGLLARVTYTSDDLSELEQILAQEQGIEDIVTHNVSGVHKKVKFGVYEFPDSESGEDTGGAVSSAA